MENYSKKLEELIAGLEGRVPRLLLHACCAPCSSYCIEYLSEFFEITVLYYNPNITPDEEYIHRIEELRRFVDAFPTKHKVEMIETSPCHQDFLDAVKGLESLPEGQDRCFICYRQRMEEAARIGAEGGYDYFTTTLSISPLKNAQKINEVGEELATIYNIEHLPSDFKKKNGYLRSTQLSSEYNMYRQDYCGCEFSKRDRYKNKT